MAGIPIACTLLPRDFETRLEELATLSRSTLLSSWRDDLILHLRFAPEAEGRVRRMVAQERKCCAFLDFYIEAGPTALAVSITAPESARGAVQEIYGQFLASDSSEKTLGAKDVA
jgi:hypothetical protein